MQKGNTGDDIQPLITQSGQSPAKATAPPPALPPKPRLAPKKAGANKQITAAAPAQTTTVNKTARKSLDLDELSETETESASKPLIDSPPPSPPAAVRQTSWAKSPRGSSDAPARSTIVSTRTKTSIPPPREKHSSLQAKAIDEPIFKIDAAERVMRSYETLQKNLREGLGDKPAVYFKAIGEIKAAIKFLNDNPEQHTLVALFSKPIRMLNALIPDTTKKSQLVNNAEDSAKKISSDDDHQSTENRTSGEAVNAASATSSSPDDKSDKSPQLVLKKSSADIKSLASHSNNDEVSQDSPPRSKAQPEILPEQKIKQEIKLLPVRDMFSVNTLAQIIADNNLSLNSPSLVPLNEIILRLRTLEGQFNTVSSLKDPITKLCVYYSSARQQLIEAKNSQERESLLENEPVVVGDCIDYVILDKGNYKSADERARAMLQSDPEGTLVEKSNTGRTWGGIHCNAWMKVPGKDTPLKPLTEQYAQNIYGLVNQNEDMPTHTASAGIKILHTHVNHVANPNEELKEKLRFYGEHDKIERFEQCGDLVAGDDFIVALESLAAFIAWKNVLGEAVMVAHFTALEKLFINNPDSIRDISLWPEDLIKHWPKEIIVYDGKLEDALAKKLPTFFKLYHRLIPNYTPEKAVAELPSTLDRLHNYPLTALIFPNCLIDPVDLTSANLKLCSRLNNTGTAFNHWLRSFDADECLKPPITVTNGLHYPASKVVLFAMAKHLKRPVDPQWVKEILAFTPLQWVVKSEQASYNRIYKNNARLLAEGVWTEDIIYDQQQTPDNLQPDEPSSSAAKPRPRNAGRKQLALDIPFMRKLSQLPLMLKRWTRGQNALKRNPEMTLEELFKVMYPEVYIFYKRLCLDKIDESNYPGSILTVFDNMLRQTPPYEVVFIDFNEYIIPTLRRLGKKGNYGQDYFAAQAYNRLVQETNKPEVPKEQHIKTMEELSRECIIPELGISLAELLKDHNISTADSTDRLLSIPDSIKLFVDRLDTQFIPTDPKEIVDLLDMLGTHYEGIKFNLPWLKPESRRALICDAIAFAKPGAIKLLAKDSNDINALNKFGETGFHTLLRTHRDFASDNFLKTLEICLNFSTCDPDLEDSQQRTPLMLFIESMDTKDQIHAESVITLLRTHKNNVNLNLRTPFSRKNKFASKEAGTALDFAIDRDNVSAFIALLNQGAGDLVDINAALQFIKKYKGDPAFDKALELLKIRHSELAYEIYLEQISTTKPDKEHPEHCLMIGAEHGKRYLLESIWNTLFDKKGRIIKADGVKEGKHIVRPIRIPGSRDPLLYSKFYPEFPGLQRFAEILLSLFSCPTTRSELWRVNSSKDEAIPLSLITAVNGESLYSTITDTAKYKEFREKLDRNQFDLLCAILNWLAEEDGHADQFNVVRIPTPEGEKMIPVPFDLERILVSAYLRKGDKIFLLMKSIVMFLHDYRHLPMTPQTISTLLNANGKRFSSTVSTREEMEQHIRENYNRLFDKLASCVPNIEAQHLALFPRDEKVKSCTLTGKQMFKIQKSFKAKVGSTIDRFVSEEEKETNKVVEDDNKSERVQALNSVRKGLGISEFITVLGLPIEARALPVLSEHAQHTALVLLKYAGRPITNHRILSEVRPNLYPEVNGVVLAHPRLNPCEQYKIFTEGFTKEERNNTVPRTTTSQMSYLQCVSQPASGRYQSTGECVTAQEAVNAYKKAKQTSLMKTIARVEISRGDTTKLQNCNNVQEFETLANNIKWNPRNEDNRAVIDTMILVQKENKLIMRKHLRVVNCKSFTLDDFETILKMSPFLETIELTGTTLTPGKGLQLLKTDDPIELIALHSPNLIKLILNETTITSAVIKGDLLPRLTHFEARNCMLMRGVTIIDSRLTHLNISGSDNCERLNFEYTVAQAHKRPLDEERPLKVLDVSGCTKLNGDDITRVLDRSPFLTDFIHGGNHKFNARSFAWFAFKQGRFNRRIFESMIQNGVLNLYGLPFEDRHLAKFQEWLGAANAPKVTEFNDRGCSRTTRLGTVDFVFRKQEITRMIYGGPVRGNRTCGQIKEWNMGLKNPIMAINTLNSGAIVAFSKRVPLNARNLSSVEYNVRLPDDTAKDIHSSAYDKEVTAKPDAKPSSLSTGFDLVSSIEMSDGTLLLSLQEDSSQKSPSSYLMLLDPLTRTTQPLDVPEAGSLAGHLCYLNSTTFALHSDKFYIIQKEEMGWRIKHTTQGAHCGFEPISNGKDLVAFSFGDSTNCTLCLVNIHTGELIYSQQVKNRMNKAVLFLDDERIMYYDGDFYTVLNFTTFNFTKLEKHKKSNITDPKFAWANYLPTGELCIGGGQNGEVLDPTTLSRLFASDYGRGNMSSQIISHNGDEFFITEDGKLYIDRKAFFIMDLSFRQQPQAGFECMRAQDDSNTMTILTPETIIVDNNHIDESGNGWKPKMLSGKPTCTTFTQMILGLFEKYCAFSSLQGQKPYVTFDQQAIHITGLSEEEASTLRGLLNIFWKKQVNAFAFHAHRPEKLLSQQQSVVDLLDEDNEQVLVELN
ncbi:MAG: hypothetical protein K2X50_08345 [Gammaproteobacteria bacterium]|nr:hypothetical protein [Gammaproteobacteria bacterium]